MPPLIVAKVVGYLIHATLLGANWPLRSWPTRVRGLTPLLPFALQVAISCQPAHQAAQLA